MKFQVIMLSLLSTLVLSQVQINSDPTFQTFNPTTDVWIGGSIPDSQSTSLSWHLTPYSGDIQPVSTHANFDNDTAVGWKVTTSFVGSAYTLRIKYPLPTQTSTGKAELSAKLVCGKNVGNTAHIYIGLGTLKSDYTDTGAGGIQNPPIQYFNSNSAPARVQYQGGAISFSNQAWIIFEIVVNSIQEFYLEEVSILYTPGASTAYSEGSYSVSPIITPPANIIVSGAIEVVPTSDGVSVSWNNTYSPSDASLTDCDDLSAASSFLWYKIVATNVDRIINIDTCGTQLDTVIAVFSGVSSNLVVEECNDDGVFPSGSSCFSSSSSISDFILHANTDYYVVVGGYVGSDGADRGSGVINFDLLSNAEATLNFETFSSAISSVNSNLNNSRTDIINSVQSTGSSLSTAIQNSQSSLNTAILNSAQSILDDLQSTENLLNNIQNSLNNGDQVSSGNSAALSHLNDTINDLGSVLSGVVTSISNVQDLITSTNDNTNSNIQAIGDLISAVQSDVTLIKSQLNGLIIDLNTVQVSVDDLGIDLFNFNSSISNTLASISTLIESIQDNTVSIHLQIDQVNTTLSAQISGVSTQAADIKIAADASLNILNTLRNDVLSDTAQTLFKQDVMFYLTDANSVAPISYRTSNAFGGKLNDIATFVSNTRTTLRNSALAIGVKGSTACNNDAFCSFFLGTADIAYIDAWNKYISNLNGAKYSLAWTNLRKAYLSLYPN